MLAIESLLQGQLMLDARDASALAALSARLGELSSRRWPRRLLARQLALDEHTASALREKQDLDYERAGLLLSRPPEPLTATRLLALHAALHPLGGQWRSVRPRWQLWCNGQSQPMPAAAPAAIPAAVETLCRAAQDAADLNLLLVAPLTALDLLCIAPFLAGNQALALLVLRRQLQAAHPLLAAVALEQALLQDPGFATALLAGGEGDARPWLRLCWRAIEHSLDGLIANQVSAQLPRGDKARAVTAFARQCDRPFSLTDATRALPQVSRDMVRVVLRQMRRDGLLQAQGRGRAARWIRC